MFPKKWISFVLALEILLCIFLIAIEPTYSFDWDAYMEQVNTFMSHTQFDYTKLRGDTGPIVYPAGHLWLYALLNVAFHWNSTLMTTEYVPKQIPGYVLRVWRPTETLYCVQVLFLCVYVMFLAVVFDIYRRTTSRRVWFVCVCVCVCLCYVMFCLIIIITDYVCVYVCVCVCVCVYVCEWLWFVCWVVCACVFCVCVCVFMLCVFYTFF